MSLRYGILSLLAFLIILLLVFKNYEVWTLSPPSVPEKGTPKKPEVKTEPPPLMAGKAESESIASFIFIAEKNIFSPERKEFPVFPDPTKEKDKEKDKKPIVRPQVVLYGVTIAGEYQAASIGLVGKTLQKGERGFMTVRIGDRIGDYKLGKILTDRITLEAPEDQFEVLLYDPNAPKKRIYARTENKPAAITSTIPTPPPTATQTTLPGTVRPEGTISEKVTETRAPGPVTAAPVPTPRPRRLPLGPQTKEQ